MVISLKLFPKTVLINLIIFSLFHDPISLKFIKSSPNETKSKQLKYGKKDINSWFCLVKMTCCSQHPQKSHAVFETLGKPLKFLINSA